MNQIVEYIAKALVDHPQDLEVLMENEGGVVDIKLLVHPDDMGKIIGKKGKIANSIRSILKAAAIKEEKKVNLVIESKDEQN
ncbi:KH domain-containing protein [uncultured Helcococcus sp.]|uniref:KH domain-containing protein n=1 Tax=uncultured Helcococcus sp. TaxID=1072508 RepID=UPI002604A2B8|nr:KH domain-containing protein [uncultured Helcococcus sp.]